MTVPRLKIILFANTDWYLYNFRRSLAEALRQEGHAVLLVSPPGQYGDRLKELGFCWMPAPMERRSLNPLRELALLAWLYRLVRRERADLVHGFTIKCAVYGSLVVRLAGIGASVNAVTGMGYVFTSNELRARLLRPAVRQLLRQALNGGNTRLILQNPDDAALFMDQRLVQTEKIRLIPSSGVNCDRFSPAHRKPQAVASPMRVLLAARLLWDKGVAEYVEAARRLRDEGRAIEFLLAGTPDTGNPTAVPEMSLRAWGEEGLVQWLGHVDDMPALFQSVDVAVLPSYREGLPKGLIEAAACGLALVTTDVPGCREVVTDGVEGLLVPARDAGALASAIATLHDDGALRSRLGASARQKALAAFDEKLVIRRTIAVYEELVSRQPTLP